jgi:hypothetical protein
MVKKKGAGVIWNGDPLDPRVIPAKAGIQSVDSASPWVCEVDSRFRGNDAPNDTTTRRRDEINLEVNNP